MVPSILALYLWAQAPAELPAKVADYGAFLAAQQHVDNARYREAVEALRPIWSFTPVSPLLGRAAIVAAKAYEQLGEYAEALEILRNHTERLPQPEGYLLLARNAEAAADNAGAAAYFQKIFYNYPLSEPAVEADAALIRLKAILAENFPPAMPQMRLERAARLVRGGQGARARREYAAMVGDFGGLERELAQIRSVSDNHAALMAMRVTHPAADAERLYLLHAAARRAKLLDVSLAAVEDLGRQYPKSNWRLQALVSQGNAYVLRNDPATYEPLFRACYQDFPNEPEAAYCHWKIAWAAYMKREGAALFEEHLRLFPQSEKTSAALYFLRRHSELVSRFPLSYYSTLVRQRSARVTTAGFQPGLAMKIRLERAELLEAAGYPEWAEFELQWAGQNEANSYPAALALAETASRRGAHDVSIRYIKRFAPGYLAMPIEAAPERFWKLAFPLPYRSALESNSRVRDLDPYIVAALIRQESEFNPRAISSAKAYGLTQVLPSTGRQLSRRVGISGFSPSMLLEPEVNIKLGTYYLRSLLDQQNGSWEQTLAAYNAGKSRADEWATWATYREPAEYIETIPFTETRNYIQIVLRNAHVYRRLYSASAR